MSDIVAKYFGGYDLGSLGLVTPEAWGIHSLPSDEVARTWIPGDSIPHDRIVRTAIVPMGFKCVVVEDTHEDLCRSLSTLRSYMLPGLGWQTLELPTERPGLRTFAHSLGFPVDIDALPYITRHVEFRWELERYPWWEDADEITASVAGTSGSVYNTGPLEAPATYTCTATAELADGLSFSVGGKIFAYEGAIANGQVLIVYTTPPDVTLAGSRDFANTSSSAEFPKLAAGENAITKSSADFDLDVSFRRRYP